MNTKLILASQSPRRRELLSQLGYQFECLPADIDESPLRGESPSDYVTRLAHKKALYVAKNQPDTTIVLGSDTSVIKDGIILGKPCDFDQCKQHLLALSGSVHQVLTAISVVKAGLSKTVLVSTDVEFKVLSSAEMNRYWQTGEPQDKAGSYGIQGIAGQFVKNISGSYSAVVGLPLYETAQLLADFGLPTQVQQD